MHIQDWVILVALLTAHMAGHSTVLKTSFSTVLVIGFSTVLKTSFSTVHMTGFSTVHRTGFSTANKTLTTEFKMILMIGFRFRMYDIITMRAAAVGLQTSLVHQRYHQASLAVARVPKQRQMTTGCHLLTHT